MRGVALLCLFSATLVLFLKEIGAADVNLNDCVDGSMTDRKVCSDQAYDICQKAKMVPICCPNTNAAPVCVCCQGWSRPDNDKTTCPCLGRKANPAWCFAPKDVSKNSWF